MRYIITEEQNLRLRLLRRINLIDDMILPTCKKILGWSFDFCRHGVDVFVVSVAAEIAENMYWDHFNDFMYLDDDSEDWKMLSEMMKERVLLHYETIKNYYKSKCKD